ncbi:MAG: HAD family hydrolase [Planctomycetota bacterium]|jgi:phosphoglycolate phosphatase-like HAD superfamily hydrolase
MPKLALFDLDGTLLHSHGAGMRAIQRAGQALFGRDFDLSDISFAGAIDPHIFQIGAERAGVDPTPDNEAAFARAYRRELEDDLNNNGGTVRSLPGAAELIRQVAEHPSLTLGLLTGNYTQTGPVKLRGAGIDETLFQIQVYGDDGADRAELVGVAIQRYRQRFDDHLDGDDVVVIGDTPRDVDCAKSHGCRCLAVATGPFDTAELERAGADAVLDDLSDTEAFWRLLGLG